MISSQWLQTMALLFLQLNNITFSFIFRNRSISYWEILHQRHLQCDKFIVYGQDGQIICFMSNWLKTIMWFAPFVGMFGGIPSSVSGQRFYLTIFL
jgi:hypothetical protein